MQRPIIDQCEHHDLFRNKTSRYCYPSPVVFYEEAGVNQRQSYMGARVHNF